MKLINNIQVPREEYDKIFYDLITVRNYGILGIIVRPVKTWETVNKVINIMIDRLEKTYE